MVVLGKGPGPGMALLTEVRPLVRAVSAQESAALSEEVANKKVGSMMEELSATCGARTNGGTSVASCSETLLDGL